VKFRWGRLRSSARIALLTPYDGGNLGDAAIQEALIANFRRCDPQIQLCGITLNPARTSAQHHIPCYPLAATSRSHYEVTQERASEVDGAHSSPTTETSVTLYRRLRRLARYLPFVGWLKFLVDETLHVVQSYRLLRNVDVLVVAGGGQLDDEWGGSWGHPYTLVKWSVLARTAGSSVVFLSVGACRMDSRLTKLFLRIALSLACYRSYRDHESKKLALTLTERADGLVVPDIAFSLPLTKHESVAPPDMTRLRVGVSPIAFARPGLWPTEDPAQYEHYVTQLASFVAALLHQQIAVILFSSSCPDEQIFEDLCARLDLGPGDNFRALLSTSNVTSVHDLLVLLQSVDFVVASRLHGILLSLLSGKPSIAIVYDRKVTCLMEELDQKAYCLDVQSLESEDLLRVFLALQANGHIVVEKLNGIRRQYDQCLQSQYRQIARLALGHSGTLPAHKEVSSDDHSGESTADVGPVGIGEIR
jgi:polysaccharide pyruvyl transferase WcaK-like protein